MESIALAHFLPEHLPERQKGWKQLLLWPDAPAELSVPAIFVKGNNPGPLVLAVAGVHGDEFEGMEAIRQFGSELDPAQLSGTFIGIPVVNPLAYAAQTRETPPSWDGLNLARQFPGRASGSVTQCLAYHWSNWAGQLLGPDDLFIDFHSAGTRYEYLPLIAFHETGDQTEQSSRALARIFGWENLWRIPDQEDTRVTFNGSIARRGIPTLATEAPGRGDCRAEDVSSLKSGLQRLLAHKQMLPFATLATELPETAWSTDWLLIQSCGLFQAQVDLRAQVQAGQTLGRILSLTGDILEEVFAPVSGVIWGIRRFSTVRPGDHVFLLAFPI